MKTTHRIATALLLTIALANCAADTDVDDDPPEENVTTDTNVEDDESED